MEGYKLKINGMPRPLFAFRISAENYEWENTPKAGGLEIALTKGAPLTRRIGNTVIQDPECALRVISDGEDISLKNSSDKPITIATVKVILPSAEIERVTFTAADAGYADNILLPLCIDASVFCMVFDKLINSYISAAAKPRGYAGWLKCAAAWLEIVTEVDGFLRQALCGKPFTGTEYYIKKVDSLIESRYNETLNIADIAKVLGITPNYLSSVYKKGTGKTITEALNCKRIETAHNLIAEGEKPQAAAEKVGINSAAYLRRLYKRYYGTGINESAKIDRELTLYFKKPWEN